MLGGIPWRSREVRWAGRTAVDAVLVVFGTIRRSVSGGIPWTPGRQVTSPVSDPTRTWWYVTAEELAVGDRVQAMGVPIGIWATRLTVDDVAAAAPQGGPGAPGMPGMGMGRGVFGMGPGGAMASASGEIISLDPLTIQFAQPSDAGEQQFQAKITLADDASLSNVVPSDWNAIQAGQTVFGMANPDDQGRLVLTSLTIIDTPEAFMGGMGMMGPGMGMGPPVLDVGACSLTGAQRGIIRVGTMGGPQPPSLCGTRAEAPLCALALSVCLTGKTSLQRGDRHPGGSGGV